MSWIISDLKSFLPLTQSPIQPASRPGSSAPSFTPSDADGQEAAALVYPLKSEKPSVVVFVRHLGCPFCQQTIQEGLYPLSRKHKDEIEFFLVTQSDRKTTEDYLSNLPVDSPLPAPFTVLPSPPPHTLYSHWGISQLSLSSVISPSILSAVSTLKSEKSIANTETHGSRWLNSGAFAVDGEGKVVWSHVAERADDVSDLAEGVKALEK